MYAVLGNSVTSFAEPVAELRFVSEVTIKRDAARPPRGEVDENAASDPLVYSMQDRFLLGRMLKRHRPDPADRIGAWFRRVG